MYGKSIQTNWERHTGKGRKTRKQTKNWLKCSDHNAYFWNFTLFSMTCVYWIYQEYFCLIPNSIYHYLQMDNRDTFIWIVTEFTSASKTDYTNQQNEQILKS